jgi:Flp pilus assembly protein TadB
MNAGSAGIAAGILTGTAVLALGAKRSAADRLCAVMPRAASKRAVDSAGARVRSQRAAAVLAAASVTLLVSPPAGLVAGPLLAALLLRWFSRLEPREVRRVREQMTADLPLAVELLATSLAAGATPYAALRSVATAIEGPLGERLEGVAGTLAIGVDPIVLWDFLGSDPVLGPVARTLGRSSAAGVPAAAALERTAEQLRARRRSNAEAAAQTVAVKAIAPVGLCFLPAFVLLGIVPTVWGLGVRALSLDDRAVHRLPSQLAWSTGGAELMAGGCQNRESRSFAQSIQPAQSGERRLLP